MKSKLLDTTARLLESTDLPLDKISSRTGLTVAWLRDFRRGRMADPSVVKVETLYNLLAARKLTVPTT